MNTILLPIAAFLIAILLVLVFFGKKNVENNETKIYSKMLIANLMYSILAIVTFVYAKTVGNELVISLFQKVYMILTLAIVALIVIYNVSIIDQKQEKKNIIYKGIVFSFCLISFLILILPLNVINHGDVIDGNGLSYDAMLIGMMIYLIFTIMSSIYIFIKNKRNFSKDIPFVILIIFYVIGLIVRNYFPDVMFENFFVSFTLLMMYFTIENPDVKMLEEVNIAKERAEQANAAKTDFLSSMSHEIRTPLNAIVGFSEAIEEEKDLDSAKNDAKDIVLAANNLLEIVNGILDISKIEANKMEIVEKEYNPTELFESIAKLTKPRIGEKPIELKVEIAKDLPASLYGDSGKLKQITTNILTNAVKYTEEGSITYVVSCVNLNNESSLVISVEDTGRGIKEDQIDKLFTKFERLEEDRNTTLEGTGLGLAITKKLVEMMGGKIVVQSVYGSGSKFTVYIKQKINHEVKTANKGEKELNLIRDFTGKKVLVVDDNSLNLKVANRLLRNFNLDIFEASSGFECIDMINNKKEYDLILMDDMMPKMTGTETLEKLKKDITFKTPVVILTANAIEGMKSKYIEKGFDDYLAKPIERLELERVLNKFLNPEFDNLDKTQTKIEITQTKIEIIDSNSETRKIIEETKVEGITPAQLEEAKPREIIPEKVEEINENTNTKEYLESNGIDVNHGLELLGDIDMYNSIMEDFIAEMEQRFPKLEEYKNNEDMPNYAVLVHAIKSDCKYLGIMDLAEHNYQHELKSKANDIQFVKEDYDSLIEDIHKYLEICKKYLNK